MKVSELIEYLKTHPQDIDVTYDIWSESALLKPTDIRVVECCLPRPDGWVEDKRPDMPTQRYLRLP